jgi:SAM-dependent methyltransferase
MAQIETGIRGLLAYPLIYRLHNSLTGKANVNKTIVNEYVKPKKGDKILDIGCGEAEILEYLPEVDYLGVDGNEKYIAYASKRYKDKARFLCDFVDSHNLEDKGKYDFMFAFGLIHHINDEDTIKLFQLAKLALKPGGKLITFDGVYTEDQSKAARWLISKDRGQCVRDIEGYTKLASKEFSNFKYSIRHDLYRIPYTLLIMECFV